MAWLPGHYCYGYLIIMVTGLLLLQGYYGCYGYLVNVVTVVTVVTWSPLLHGYYGNTCLLRLPGHHCYPVPMVTIVTIVTRSLWLLW